VTKERDQLKRSRFVIEEGDIRITGHREPDADEVQEADRILSKVMLKKEGS
jgi:peroxiredoxin